MTKERSQLFRARYLLPMTSGFIEDGAVLIAGGRIVAVDRFSVLRSVDAEVIDYGDAVILPPLVNAHCHLELSHFPQWAKEFDGVDAPTDFVGWIRRLVRVRRQVGVAEIPPAIAAGIQQLLASGTGAVGDILTTHDALPALLASPLFGRVFFETIGLDEERFSPLLESALAATRQLFPPLGGGLSPHATYTISPRHLDRAVGVARNAGLPLAIHCAESPEESTFLREGRGAIATELYAAAGWPIPSRAAGESPVAWLAAHGALTPQTLLIHGVQVDRTDAARIAASGATVVLCPRSNARLGVGVAPVALYKEAGVPLALGTDSLASNDSLSLWDEIAFARSVYPEFSPRELLDLATTGGAHALGLTSEMGRLTPGGGANLQVVTASALPAVADLDEWLCSAEHQVVALWLSGVEVLHQDAPCQKPPQHL